MMDVVLGRLACSLQPRTLLLLLPVIDTHPAALI